MQFKFILLGLLFYGSFSLLSAQISSQLLPDQLSINDAGSINVFANYGLGQLQIYNGFDFTEATPTTISTGSDLLRSTLEGGVISIEDFVVVPKSTMELRQKDLRFITENLQDFPNNFSSTWDIGITDLGQVDDMEPAASNFRIWNTEISTDIAFLRPVFEARRDGTVNFYGGFLNGFPIEQSRLFVEGGAFSYGIYSRNSNTTGSLSEGIIGVADGSGSGWRYGVVGLASGGISGNIGIYGSGSSYGVYSVGDLAYTGSLVKISDRQFKTNIEDFEALEMVLQLQPRRFEYQTENFPELNFPMGKQFGFVAQEVQEILPELVVEKTLDRPTTNADGEPIVDSLSFLALEPIEMISLLVQAFKEQHSQSGQQINRIKSLEAQNEQLVNELNGLKIRHQQLLDRLEDLEPAIDQVLGQVEQAPQLERVTSARLLQNSPNPFSESTRIQIELPEGVQQASLRISNQNGNLLKEIIIEQRGLASVELQAFALAPGIYSYTLIVDGQGVDTRQMVLLK